MSTRLIDTSILVDLLRGRSDARRWLATLSPGDAAISFVTAAELVAGARNLQEQQAVEREVALYPIIWDSEASSRLAWQWYRQYHLTHGVGFLDCLIGAAGYEHGLVLCTLNDKHFRPFPGIQVKRP